MTLRKGLVWNGQTKEIEGFEDLFSVGDEDRSIVEMIEESDKQVATELLVFWFVSYGKIKASFPLGHFAVSKPTSPVIHDLWRGSVKFAHEHGWVPIAGCCDGASENEKFIRRSADRSGKLFRIADLSDSKPLSQNRWIDRLVSIPAPQSTQWQW
jgi:hypothetical protein